MQKRARRHPKSGSTTYLPSWLLDLPEQARPGPLRRGSLPPWQASLWPHLSGQKPTRVLLRGTVRLPAMTAPAVIASPSNRVRCGIRQTVSSPRGHHGVQLFLTREQGPAEASAFLLTPAVYARFRAGSESARVNAQVRSLADPVTVLDLAGLRAEFVVREVEYGEESLEPDLVRSLTIEVTVWDTSRRDITPAESPG